MDAYHAEQEQIEALKRWWKENATFVITGLVIGALAVFGWRAWQAHEIERAAAASLTYERLWDAVERGDREQAEALGRTLREDYAATPYAVHGALALAGTAVTAGDLDRALAELEWALDHVDDPALAPLIRLRHARVLLARNEPQAALDTLAAGGDAGRFAPLHDEVRGDAWLALGKVAEARAAYQRALEALASDASAIPDADAGLIRMKLEDLPPAVEQATPAQAAAGTEPAR
ncbi:MAG TPA: tetratricopeptide repeat protein [Gammaproteobacteria bacterium]|nr:tetratricopeptide repeat protein [Gammaproteobacteria bacterium]